MRSQDSVLTDNEQNGDTLRCTLRLSAKAQVGKATENCRGYCIKGPTEYTS